MSVFGVERVADDQRARVVDERLEVVVVDRLEDVEALGRGADLAGVQEGGPRAALRGDVDRRRHVGADDERVLAAELEVDPGHPVGADVGDLLARLDGAGERDAVDALVGDDRLADLPGAREDVDHAGREVLEAFGQRERRERRQLGRLGDDRVPGGERRRDLPRQQQQRVVPGDDAADDAHRLLEDEGELRRLDRRDHPAREVAPELGVVVERRGRPPDLVRVLDQRLAALQRHQLGELVGAGAHPRSDLVEHLPALDRGRRGPGARRLPRRRDRGVDLLGRGEADRGELLLRERVLDRERVALARDLLTRNEQPCLHQPSLAIRVPSWTRAPQS